MNKKTINPKLLSTMFLAGAKNLEAKKEWINELNVFPVPDGDTGTNMTLTIISAANEVGALDNPSMQQLAKAISSGSLRGARGNSGVILSQLLRGFTRSIEKEEELGTKEISRAMEKGVETAYKAVMKPKEGTILTVAREAASMASRVCEETDDLDLFFQKVLAHAKATLNRTPDMLPVLKEAGVVDSGGQGLLEVLKGAYDGFLGKEIDYSSFKKPEISTKFVNTNTEETDIKFGYCTEFIVVLNNKISEKEEADFKEFLTSIGDSIVLVADDEIIKVHVHTNHPGKAMEKGLTFGSLSRIKVDNMREEHQERLIKNASEIAKKEAEANKVKKLKEVGFITVSVGEGLSEIFKDLGADYIIKGGQTMNPSTEDMLSAIDEVNAKTIYILPNNKNIILAANQARDLTDDKEIIVVPTKTIPQGITALVSFVPEKDSKENVEAMLEGISMVKTGQITYAVRNTKIDSKEIHEGDIMGLGDSGLLSVGSDIKTTTMETIAAMVDDDTEIISLYYGSDVTEEEANSILDEVANKYDEIEVELNYGGQPIYYYLISVE